jgi:NAD-dependent dihydropyrimidine dehydrogenase PreA subunit
MSSTQTVWVDLTLCTGCNACVTVCPVGAIALVDGKAHLNEEMCTGCGACVSACPADAIHPVVQGELIPAPARPAPTIYRPNPLTETAGAAVVATGVGLLAKAGGALARALGRWLTRPSTVSREPMADAPAPTAARSTTGRARRARHRRRGR